MRLAVDDILFAFPLFNLYAICLGQYNPLCNDEAVSIGDCYIEEGLPRTNPPSYAMYALSFLPVCALSNMTRLINCYNKVLNACPYYRDNGPAIMDKSTFLSFIVGICINKPDDATFKVKLCNIMEDSVSVNLIDEGVACVGRRDYLIHQYNNKLCLTGELAYDDLWDAYIMMGDWTWEKYCRLMVEGIECSVKNARQFGCTNEFWEVLRLSSYLRLPIECHKPNTTEYNWLNIYTEIPDVLEFTEKQVILNRSPVLLPLYYFVLPIILISHFL